MFRQPLACCSKNAIAFKKCHVLCAMRKRDAVIAADSDAVVRIPLNTHFLDKLLVISANGRSTPFLNRKLGLENRVPLSLFFFEL